MRTLRKKQATGRDKSLGSKRGAGTAGETTIQRWRREKKLRRIDGVRSTLHNPIPEKFGELQIIHSLKDIFVHFEDVQINSIIPEIDNFEFVNSKLGKVTGGNNNRNLQMIPKFI